MQFGDFMIQFWHWLVLAALLAGIELITPGFFFIWLGGAALVVGVVVLVFPGMGWETQFVVFAILCVVSVLGWYKIGRRLPGRTDDATLNRRGEQLVGRSGKLADAIVNGRGKVNIGDSVWSAGGVDLPAGTSVRVVSVEGTMLRVEPLP